ncbi:MAG: rhodanese-like domain-containing protein [Leptolyngbyaceae cyanobacterium]
MPIRPFSSFRHRNAFLFLVGLLLPGVGACYEQSLSWDALKSEIRREFPTVEHISVAELEQRLIDTTSDQMLIVDVRRPEEFAVSHLQNAVNLEDPAAIVALAEQTQADQIVVYCSVGYRSARVAAELENQGLDAVVNLEGSIFAWANSQRPVFQASKPVGKVHPFDQTWGQLLDRQYHPEEQ